MASIAAKKNPLTSKKSSTVNSRVHASDSISIGENPLVAEKDVVDKAKRRTSDFGADFAYAREEDDMSENIGIGKHAVETVSSVAKSDSEKSKDRSSARFVAGTGINALNSKHKAPQSMAKSSQSSSNTKSEVAKENPVDEKSLQPEANNVAIGRKSITQRRQSVGFQIMDVFEDKLGIVAIDQTDEIDESMSIQDQFLEMQTRLEMRCEEASREVGLATTLASSHILSTSLLYKFKHQLTKNYIEHYWLCVCICLTE